MANHNGSMPLVDNPLTRFVWHSASQVLNVGRGAYERAGSGGSRLVGGLVDVGGRIDREAKSRVFEARSSAAEVLHRLEVTFAHRVARALNALQIPTARDVHELNARVEALQKAVVALERRATEAQAAAHHAAPPRDAPARPRAKAGPRKKNASARKPAAKRAPVKRTPAPGKAGA